MSNSFAVKSEEKELACGVKTLSNTFCLTCHVLSNEYGELYIRSYFLDIDGNIQGVSRSNIRFAQRLGSYFVKYRRRHYLSDFMPCEIRL